MTEPTLHHFVTKLLSDASARELFDSDPVAALGAAGLSDVTPQDVMDAIPLVLDLASASGEGLAIGGGFANGPDGMSGGGGVESALGTGGVAFGLTDNGLSAALGLDSSAGGGVADLGVGAHGVSGELSDYALGVGGHGVSGEVSSLAFGVGPTGVFVDDAGTSFGIPLDQDTIGRGGDLVTGTVAGVAGDGTAALASYLTEGAGALSVGLGSSSQQPIVGGLIDAGAAQLSDVVADATSSVPLPALPTPGLADLPVADLPVGDLPVDLPHTPALPELGDLPIDLPIDLPVDLPDLPIDLPSVPSLPALPEVPALPSVPGLDVVHDTVGGLTSQVPLVSDLTDGMDNPLGL